MPCRHHSLRSRSYAQVALHPGHGECLEIALDTIMFLATVMYLLASAFFYSGLPASFLALGELLWMIGSLIFLVVAILELIELCGSRCDKTICQNPVLYEQLVHVFSTLVFTTGTVLLWSGFYGGNRVAEEKGELNACYCLIVGSFGFLVSTIWNWMSFSFADEAEDGLDGGDIDCKGPCITRSALFCASLGSVCFILGSWLFSLDVEDGCDEYLPPSLLTAQQTKTRGGNVCVSIDDQATVLFMVGSAFFLVQNGLNLVKVCIKHNSGYDEVDAHSDSERLLE